MNVNMYKIYDMLSTWLFSRRKYCVESLVVY